jgi:uncharacterized protein (TIGR02594 family)
MAIKTDLLATVVGAALLFGPMSAAEAGHRHHHHHAQIEASASFGFAGGDLVSTARSYIGTNPTGRRSLWCGAFMDFVLKRTGHAGGGNLAEGYRHYGTRVSLQVGAIAVMGRSGGGHVGVVSATSCEPSRGKGPGVMIISGNHNHTTGEGCYPQSRIQAYVVPNG